MSLVDRVVVVSGGARGIGRALVEGFVGEGSRVVAIDLSWESERDFKDHLEEHGALVLSADVTDESTLAAALADTLSAFGTVDVLVNNAGLRQGHVTPAMFANVLDLDVDKWTLMLDVNVLGPLRTTRQFARPMLENKSGSIINVGSYTGDFGIAGLQPYACSKAALKNWTLSLAEELRDHNIAVNAFSPAFSWTTGSGDTREAQKALGKTEFPPVFRADSCVGLVLMLAQQDARLTGRWIADVIEWNQLHGLGGRDVWEYIP